MIFKTILFTVSLFICTFISATATLQFQMNEGRLELKTTDIAAVTDTKYVTTAWVVHGEPRYGRPTNGQHSLVVNIAKSYSFPENPSPGSLVTSFFEMDEAEMTRALIHAGVGNINQHSVFYISGVFQIVENGIKSARKYESLTEIRNARNWHNPNVFTQYYDIKVTLDSAFYPLKITYQNDLGEIMRSEIVANYKAGDLIQQKIDEVYSFAGDDYRILNSYAVSQNNPQKQQWVADQSVLVRNLTMPLGWFEIVAVYRKVDDGQVTAIIGSNVPGNERYDVEKAIPAGKPLYVTIKAQPFRIQHKFKHIKGTFNHQIQVKRKIQRNWEEWREGKWVKHTTTDERFETINVPMDYSYWRMEQLQVFKLHGATITNQFFHQKTQSILLTQAEKDHLPSPLIQKVAHTQHVLFPNPQTIVMSPEYIHGARQGQPNIPSLTNQQISKFALPQLKVRNDRLRIDGQIIMDDVWHVQHSKDPKTVRSSFKNHVITISKSGIQSNEAATNAVYASTGFADYRSIDMSGKISLMKVNVTSINSLAVHTPLIISMNVNTERKWIQIINPTNPLNYLVLGKPFHLHLSNTGDHIDAKGYQNIHTNEFVEKREIRFSFDVMYDGKVLAQHKWYQLPARDNSFSFVLLVKSKAGGGIIEIRDYSRACANLSCKFQQKANLSRSHGGVSQLIKVEKIGTISKFRISSIGGYVAPDDRHWAARHLPVYPYHYVKTSPTLIYQLQTIGNYHQTDSCVRIKRRYFHINRDGKNRQEVDLYLKQFDNEIKGYRLQKLLPVEEVLGSKKRFYVSPDQTIQMWKSRFSLPNELVLFSRSTREMISISGSLIVHFDLFAEALCNQPRTNSQLRYNNQPYANQWSNEGYDGLGYDGDIAVYRWNSNTKKTYFITN